MSSANKIKPQIQTYLSSMLKPMDHEGNEKKSSAMNSQMQIKNKMYDEFLDQSKAESSNG